MIDSNFNNIKNKDLIISDSKKLVEQKSPSGDLGVKTIKGLKENDMSISDNVSMFYNAKPHIFEKAKVLRNNMTDVELILWEKLSGKQMLGLRFRAQHPMDIFIADFYCHHIKLVIEVDGGIHKTIGQSEYDIGRTAELNYWEIEVIRFTNEEIKKDINQVIKKIERICKNRLSKLPQSPLQGI